MTYLKQCPFCKAAQDYPDGPDYWNIICGDKDEDSGWSAQYQCSNCCASGPHVSGYADEESAIDAAIEAWNTRVESRELPEWVKNEIQTEIETIKIETIKRFGADHRGYVDENTMCEIAALIWVLSLKNPEAKP
jgi:hypothetical protein